MPRSLNPCSYLPRRLQLVASLSAFILFCIVFLGRSDSEDIDPYLRRVPLGPQLQLGAHHAVEGAQHLVNKIPSPPSWLNPLKAPAHEPPPEQRNSSRGGVRWYSDWKWKNPFSSSITFEEERAVLPPLKERPTVYTYYDAAARRKDEKSRKAEQEILQVWRRAWWAQGFSPVILTDSEAKNNPLYRRVQGLKLEPEMEMELMRWLAWGNMGTGILCNWLAVPMAPFDDQVLTFLRRGEFPALTQFTELDGAVYYGTRDHIVQALKEIVRSPAVGRVKSIVEALPRDFLKEDAPRDAIAFYNKKNLDAKYPLVKKLLADESTIGDALAVLPPLINSHLHATWQSFFPKGIAVIKPLPEHTTNLIEPAIDIARNLSQCPSTPIPASCPPNRRNCKPCSGAGLPIETLTGLRNSSSSSSTQQQFAIATVPHPYTLITLLKQRDDALDLRFVRRETSRDPWTLAASAPAFGAGPSSFARLPSLKDAVASDAGAARSLWLTAERPRGHDRVFEPADLGWIFGFTLPQSEGAAAAGASSNAAAAANSLSSPPQRPPPPAGVFGEAAQPTEEQLVVERKRLARAEQALRSASSIRDVVEAWNLADTEIWKFVRAYNARRRVERQQWEQAEDAFQGKATFDRWIDKIT